METNFSRIIQGCMGWGAWGKQLSQKDMIDLIHHCLEQGITTFDHADIYGDYTTEADFGKAFSESGVARESVQLISKCGIQYVGQTRNNPIKHYQYDAEYIIWSAEKSIKDLKAGYLDLLLLHRPSPLMRAEEVAKAVDKLLAEGKIKSFGVSNFTTSQTELIQAKNHVSYNQMEISLTSFQPLLDGALDYMTVQNIVPMSWSPLGTVFKEKNEQTARIHTALESLTEKYSATKDQLLLAWLLKHPSGIHPVVGTATKERIKNAAQATTLQLSETDWFQLWVASLGHKVP
tara:strand:- start:280 stop:1149 length:870 start_codon:yes stop_codon:yes gene_type:complete